MFKLQSLTQNNVHTCCLQAVRGDVKVALEWQFTREGLLLKEVELLERLLSEKVGVGVRR